LPAVAPGAGPRAMLPAMWSSSAFGFEADGTAERVLSLAGCMSWTILYIISEWLIRLIMLGVVTHRRRPSSATAWLMVIFFQPWVGLLLYLLFGEDRLPRLRIEQHSRLMRQMRTVIGRFEDQNNVVQPELDPTQRSVVRLAQHLGHMPILGGNHADFMSRTQEVIDRLVADIDAAEEHVHLMFYIFAPDATGERVLDALGRAAHRGVRCRLLVDAVGSRLLVKTKWREIAARGILMRPMLTVGKLRQHMARMDLRNHRKLAVIDGRVAYTGSQNIVDAGYGHKDLSWHDVMVRLSGPVVLELQEVFVLDWYFETGELLGARKVFPEPSITGDFSVQTLPSGPSYPIENYQRFVVAAVYAARQRVIITTPYFIPDEPFLEALQVAIMRGVDVDVIVPRRVDQLLVGIAGRSYYSDLLDAGVRVSLYTHGLLHSKTMSIDDAIGLVGTGNFDIRSFDLNFELNLVFYGEHATAALRTLQHQYLSRSFRLNRADWAKRPLRQRLAENVIKLTSPLL